MTEDKEKNKTEDKKEKSAEKPSKKKINLIYAGLLLHSAGKPINTANIKKIVDATGEKIEDSEINALVTALEDINIDEVIEKAAAPVMVTSPAAQTDETSDKNTKESSEEQEKKAESAAEGLGALFG